MYGKPGYKPTNITTKTTTVVSLSQGTLFGISINKPGTADTLTIYDNTSAAGTVIATITAPVAGLYRLSADCYIGCTIVSGGTTAGDYTALFAT